MFNLVIDAFGEILNGVLVYVLVACLMCSGALVELYNNNGMQVYSIDRESNVVTQIMGPKATPNREVEQAQGSLTPQPEGVIAYDDPDVQDDRNPILRL
tara:strand:- start:15280 stop:15576 length:297 start_codon:yes stop_codon:yes gene_type:complete